MNRRMFPPTQVANQTRTVNGRAYAGSPGVAIDVPECDAFSLSANGWTDVCASGPTPQRPAGTLGINNAARGAKFFDTTLGQIIESDGLNWRDPATGNIV